MIGALKAAYPTPAIYRSISTTPVDLGMVNTMAAIESGITEVQSALGGLGGCPFAPGASGNLSTEDMIWMLNEMGYETGSRILQGAGGSQVSGKPYPRQLQRPSHPYRARPANSDAIPNAGQVRERLP